MDIFNAFHSSKVMAFHWIRREAHWNTFSYIKYYLECPSVLRGGRSPDKVFLLHVMCQCKFRVLQFANKVIKKTFVLLKSSNMNLNKMGMTGDGDKER